jgi:hypothetical protein
MGSDGDGVPMLEVWRDWCDGPCELMGLLNAREDVGTPFIQDKGVGGSEDSDTTLVANLREGQEVGGKLVLGKDVRGHGDCCVRQGDSTGANGLDSGIVGYAHAETPGCCDVDEVGGKRMLDVCMGSPSIGYGRRVGGCEARSARFRLA